MATRRSLTSAFDMTPDKLAFIRGGSGVVATAGSAPSAPPSATADVASAGEPPAATRKSSRKQREDSPLHRPLPPDADTEPPSLLGEVLVPVTTRVRPETANALRRAYLEQKLAGRRPATQQEIIEEALVAWLDKHGYL